MEVKQGHSEGRKKPALVWPLPGKRVKHNAKFIKKCIVFEKNAMFFNLVHFQILLTQLTLLKWNYQFRGQVENNVLERDLFNMAADLRTSQSIISNQAKFTQNFSKIHIFCIYVL